MTPLKRAGLVGGSVTSALAIAVALIMPSEGLVTKPHVDPVGIPDVCFGDTKAPRRNYTPDECAVLLISRLASDYAPAVITCVPTLADRPNQLAASLSLAYNIGVGAFCRSTAAKRFNAGDWKGGCDAFLMWRFAGHRELPGLVKRRAAERALCLK